MAIIEELRATIRSSGKSFNLLEAEIGLGRGVIGRFVKGQRDIGLETADKVAEYFGLHLCPTEEKLNRTAKRITAMREEAENAQSRLLKVQESLAVLLRVSEGAETGGAGIDPELLRRRKGAGKRSNVPTTVAAKATPPEGDQPSPDTSYGLMGRMPPGFHGQSYAPSVPIDGAPADHDETSARKGQKKGGSKG
jgi:hypothetical protein